MVRLNGDVADAAAGRVGGGGQQLQHQLLLAEQGHLPAMVAMAELYYWASAASRDHARARALWSAAARAGRRRAGAAAGMWLRAEGGGATTRAGRAVRGRRGREPRAPGGLGAVLFLTVLEKDEAGRTAIAGQRGSALGDSLTCGATA